MFLFHGSKLITFCVMRIFVDPCVLSRIGLGSQVYKVSEPGKPGFRGLMRTKTEQKIEGVPKVDMFRIPFVKWSPRHLFGEQKKLKK